jgi:hypothetical protein
MDDFFKYMLLIIIIIIIINYELMQPKDTFIPPENHPLQLSNNIIREIAEMNNITKEDKDKVINIIINKFMMLNVITKNTTSGQKLVMYLNIGTGMSTGIGTGTDIRITPKHDDIADKVLDKFSILIEIIYPVLIFTNA